jgi:hypothetical protein
MRFDRSDLACQATQSARRVRVGMNFGHVSWRRVMQRYHRVFRMQLFDTIGTRFATSAHVVNKIHGRLQAQSLGQHEWNEGRLDVIDRDQ